MTTVSASCSPPTGIRRTRSADRASGRRRSAVANLNDAVEDADRKRSDRLVGRRRQRLPGTDVEAGSVARTHDLAVFHATSGKGPEVVRANVLDREVLAIEIEHRDDDIVDIDDPELAGPSSSAAATVVQALITCCPRG